MQKKLRTLFYGLTHEHAWWKMQTLKKLTDVFELVGVVDDSTRESPRFADRAKVIIDDLKGIPVLSENEAFSIPDIDVALVEVTNSDLMEIAAKFIERKIPIHCDKPCGQSMEPYRTLVEKCRALDLPFQIGYMYRGNPALQWIWNFVRHGGLGELIFIEADMNHDYGDATAYPKYISTFRGGILYNLGCHLCDMVAPVLGDAKLTNVNTALESAPGDPHGGSTRGRSLMKFSNGVEVLIRASSHIPSLGQRRFRIDGTNGTVDLCPIERFDGKELKFKIDLRGEGEREMSFGVQDDRYAPQLLDLAAIVRGDKRNDQDYDRDLKAHELTLAMVQPCRAEKSNDFSTIFW